MLPYRLAFRSLAPAGERSRLSVLIFHRVLEALDPLQPGEPDEAEFESRMQWIRSHFNVLPLSEAIAGLKRGGLPERPLAITFDDGYADNHDRALPILRRLGLPATFFIATGFVDGGRMFNDTVIESIRGATGELIDLAHLGLGVHRIETLQDRRVAIDRLLAMLKARHPRERAALADRVAEAAHVQPPGNLMMTSAQIVGMRRAGMEIGAHTVSHPILASVDRSLARAEIEKSRATLESIIGERVALFAYPNGRPTVDYSSEHVALVRELGFDGAVSTAWGTARPGFDPFQVPRFTPWDRTPFRFSLRLARNMWRTGFQTT